MTEQFRWHRHPDSDETFLGVDGELVIEFEDHAACQFSVGQLVTDTRWYIASHPAGGCAIRQPDFRTQGRRDGLRSPSAEAYHHVERRRHPCLPLSLGCSVETGSR